MNKRTVVLVSMTLANAMTLVDQTAVPLSLPNLMRDFGVGTQSAQWVLTASLLPLAGLLVLGGRLGDLFGRRRIFIFGCVLFAGASALGGLAPIFSVLLLCRVLQGVGGALMLPNTVAFAATERRTSSPLMSFGLLARHSNYLGATVSQFIAGMAEMGLALLFPLLLILNLGMPPGLAGLALIPTTIPMILIAPLAGRWYDRAGGRPPLMLGFALLALSGVLLAIGVNQNTYGWILPGLLLFGVALAFVLTVNDPVSLDMVSTSEQGQASGVSATAEQFGGAVGIAGLYLAFHTSYIHQLTQSIARSPLPDLTAHQALRFKAELLAAEQTGLRPKHFAAPQASACAAPLTAARRAADSQRGCEEGERQHPHHRPVRLAQRQRCSIDDECLIATNRTYHACSSADHETGQTSR